MPSARTALLLLACVACASGSFVTSLLPRAHKQRLASSAITMAQAKGVVITGGAGGVGWAYADEFMRQGHWVVICDVKDPAPAVAALKAKHQDGPSRIYGIECDVSDSASVQRLTDFASEKLGTVHFWINNAGINGGRRPFTEVPTNVVEAVVKSDPDKGKFALKEKDTAMAAAFAFLREKGAFPEDDGDSDDEPCFGDDAFDNIDEM